MMMAMASASTSSAPLPDPTPANVITASGSTTTSTGTNPTPSLAANTSTQPFASTSANTIDEAPFSNASSLITSPEMSTKPSSEDPFSLIKQEDEDAKLLASLANGLTRGNPNLNEAESKDLLTALANGNPSLIKTEAFFGDNFKPSEDLMTGISAAAMEDPSGPIQAYAKLEFPGFSYYLQTLSCTIGRRPAHMRTPALQEGERQNITGAQKMEGDVDVDLGLLKSISRLHVRIFYQDQPRQNVQYPGLSDVFGQRPFSPDAGPSQGRFVLQVLGRNGAFVDDVLVGRDAIVPLGKR
jgi:hypothetical protein